MPNDGVYCLCIELTENFEVSVGALGLLQFQKGRYVYVGSALNGLEARIRRHFQTAIGNYRVLHWHVDSLLKENGVNINSVYIKLTDEKIECKIADEVSKKGVPVSGFGCSDCSCNSHLFRVLECDFLSELGLSKRSIHKFL